MTILRSISEGVEGVSVNVLYGGNTNCPRAALCKATGSAVKVVMFGTSRTERLAS
jgi:hypothetical protein